MRQEYRNRTLFIAALDTVKEDILPVLGFYLFVDDLLISYSSLDIPIVEQRLQTTIHSLQQWSVFLLRNDDTFHHIYFSITDQ